MRELNLVEVEGVSGGSADPHADPRWYQLDGQVSGYGSTPFAQTHHELGGTSDNFLANSGMGVLTVYNPQGTIDGAFAGPDGNMYNGYGAYVSSAEQQAFCDDMNSFMLAGGSLTAIGGIAATVPGAQGAAVPVLIIGGITFLWGAAGSVVGGC